MTMPAPAPAGTPLPEPNYPMITLVISNPVFPKKVETKHQAMSCPHCKGSISVPVPAASKEDPEPTLWLVSKAHPFVPEMRIVRMHLIRGVVEVYSASDDGKAGMRDRIPVENTRLIEDAMPLDVFVEELAYAESYDPDDDEEEEEEEVPEPPPAAQAPEPLPPAANGQVS